MDQRTDERKAVSLDAVIGCPRFGLLRGRIVDLALGGLYIKVETSIVPIGAEVTVTFQPGGDVANDCLSIKGRVAHQSLHGFGIAFDGLEPHCRVALERLLPTMPVVPPKAIPVLRAI
jgi:hypothetical protein